MDWSTCRLRQIPSFLSAHKINDHIVSWQAVLKSSEKPAAVTPAQEGINVVLYPFFAKHVF